MALISTRGPWSQREDDVLMHLVANQGAVNWVSIAQKLNSRTAKQCRERYHQNLKPTLNHEPITPEEGVLIERLVDRMGKRWAEIARRLHNRSDNAVKNWWNGSMNRRKRIDRRKVPGAYGSDFAGNLSYPRAPPPLRLPPISHSSAYSRYGLVSPFNGDRPAHPAWNTCSRLPSPSTISPCAESFEAARSSTSDASPAYSASPATTSYPGPNVELPPLRLDDAGTPRTTQMPHSFSVMSSSLATTRGEQQQLLPSIRACVEGHSQLPTAPNSPQDSSPRLPPPVTQTIRKGKTTEDSKAKMKLQNLLI
ncbi:Homeodomain-like protein [Xylariaceae sp. FL0662B]|nr:Homeodomain-like protein [Xylariaceae sp. FL0662B]